jgi:hypothetical protein
MGGSQDIACIARAYDTEWCNECIVSVIQESGNRGMQEEAVKGRRIIVQEEV